MLYCICICTYIKKICNFVYIYIFIYLYTIIYIYTYIHKYNYIDVYVHIQCLYVYIYMYIYTHVCMYLFVVFLLKNMVLHAMMRWTSWWQRLCEDPSLCLFTNQKRWTVKERRTDLLATGKSFIIAFKVCFVFPLFGGLKHSWLGLASCPCCRNQRRGTNLDLLDQRKTTFHCNFKINPDMLAACLLHAYGPMLIVATIWL